MFSKLQKRAGIFSVGRAVGLVALGLLGNASVVQAQTTPFACTKGISYLFLGNTTDAYEFNIAAGSLTQKSITGVRAQLNAFGYNQRDNFIYGQRNGTSQLVRIDANYIATALDVANLTGNNITDAVVGDIDANGIMYLTRGGSTGGTTASGLNVIYRIDLTQSTLQATTLPVTPASTYINDWAVSPADGNLYAVYSNISGAAGSATDKLTLFRYTTTGNAAGTRTDLGELVAGPAIGNTDIPIKSANYGACFMDKAGDFYIVANTTGNTYRIRAPHRGNLTANYVSSHGNNQGNVDGARCPTTQVATSGPLPVQLTDFTAAAAPNRAVRLAWTTASELSNAYFEVQRSVDGRIYEAVGKVQGRGTSTQASRYSFVDAAPGSTATIYYRLRQVDTDGSFDFSPVRTVTLAAGSSPVQLAVAPNPSPAGSLQVQVQYAGPVPTEATLTLQSLLGQQVRAQAVTLQPGTNSLRLDAAVAPGAYWLTVGGAGTAGRQGVRVLLTE